MEISLYTVMRECRNYFTKSYEKGDFIIADHVITLNNDYITGQYIRIIGSLLNDGAYKVKDNKITLDGLNDEKFAGYVCSLAVPRDFIKLVNEIDAYNEKASSEGGQSDIISESYTGYSYQRATGSNGQVATWKDVFANRLNKYRKMFEERWC